MMPNDFARNSPLSPCYTATKPEKVGQNQTVQNGRPGFAKPSNRLKSVPGVRIPPSPPETSSLARDVIMMAGAVLLALDHIVVEVNQH